MQAYIVTTQMGVSVLDVRNFKPQTLESDDEGITFEMSPYDNNPFHNADKLDGRNCSHVIKVDGGEFFVQVGDPGKPAERQILEGETVIFMDHTGAGHGSFAGEKGCKLHHKIIPRHVA